MTGDEALRDELMAMLEELAPYCQAAEDDPEYRAELLDSVVTRVRRMSGGTLP